MFRKDRKSHGGGINIYVNSKCPCWQRTDLEDESLETIWLEIKPRKQKSFLLCYVYRPPSVTSSWNDDFEHSLEAVYSEDKEIILLGDFNYNYVNNGSVNNSWNNITNAHNFTQFVDKPTRVTTTTSNIIDHIYSNRPANITNIQVPFLTLSDHFPVCFTRKCTTYNENGPLHSTIQYRSYKNFNKELFLSDLESQPWSVLDMFDDPDDVLDFFLKVFLDVMDKHLPKKERRVKYKQQPDWFNQEIADAISSRDQAKKSCGEVNFKFWRQKVKKLCIQAKKSFYSRVINENRSNPKHLWKNLKSLSNKEKHYQTNYIDDEQGNPITDPQTTAETFNTFFSNIFKSVPNPPQSLEIENKKNKTICKYETWK